MEETKHGRKRKRGNLIPEGKEDGKCNDWNQLLDMKGFIRPIYYSYIIDAFLRNRLITAVLSGIITREHIYSSVRQTPGAPARSVSASTDWLVLWLWQFVQGWRTFETCHVASK